MARAATLRLRCQGCGREVLGARYPFRCPARRDADGIDHLLRPVVGQGRTVFAIGDDEGNPFVRFRRTLSAAALAPDDAELTATIQALDARVAEIEGHGFRQTPLVAAPALAEAAATSAAVWIKDETGNVAGSHKARHLMGLGIYLTLAERDLPHEQRPPLAIASCGNAALAAAVVARAMQRPLEVFVPPTANARVLERLRTLGARLHECPRDALPGDPCYRGFLAALARGALPFCCQGPDNGLTLDGGKLLIYEVAAALRQQGVTRIDQLFVQVGGGALGSACVEALDDLVALGVLPGLPKIYTVQTRGAYPLARAYARVARQLIQPRAHSLPAVLAAAARRRGAFMWPWESEPHSIAHGILDDETYDWLALTSGMLRSGGRPLVVDEDTLARAEVLGQTQGINVDATGAAGLAGLLALPADERPRAGEQVLVIFSGARR